MAALVFVIVDEGETSAYQLKESIDWQCTSLGRSYAVKTWPLPGKDFNRDCSSSGIGVREVLCDCLKEFCGRVQGETGHNKSYTLILLPSSAQVEKDFVSELCSKISEYSGTVLCSSGYRIFPHPREEGGGSSYQEGHIAFYDELSGDRPLHIFAAGSVVVIPSTTLLQECGSVCPEFSSLGHWWASFVISTCTGSDIWKVKLQTLKAPFQPPAWTGNELSEKFYHFLYESNWPLGVSDPFSGDRCDLHPLLPNVTPTALWNDGFIGFNMLSEPASELDLADAVLYGAKVIRCGAVGDAKDLQYLINSEALSVAEDQAHLDKVIPKLRKALQRIDGFGLKAILTFSDLPGCSFYSRNGSEFDFFSSPSVRNRISQFWGYLVLCITDLKHCIAAYDVINEPYSKADTLAGFFDAVPSDGAAILNAFYQETVDQIRKSDTDTVIILKPLNWGSPKGIEMLKPIPDDSNIAYGFHMYGPTTVTQTIDVVPQIGYPGVVKGHHFNKQVILEVLCCVHKWQKAHDIEAKKIVCTEFGCGRLVPGCSQFLTDLVSMFHEFGWSWLLFSFRDPEWHSMDYELGTDPNNFLFRQRSALLHALFEAN